MTSHVTVSARNLQAYSSTYRKMPPRKTCGGTVCVVVVVVVVVAVAAAAVAATSEGRQVIWTTILYCGTKYLWFLTEHAVCQCSDA